MKPWLRTRFHRSFDIGLFDAATSVGQEDEQLGSVGAQSSQRINDRCLLLVIPRVVLETESIVTRDLAANDDIGAVDGYAEFDRAVLVSLVAPFSQGDRAGGVPALSVI